MDRDERCIARYLFQNKILKANAQAFEDIFTQIMSYSNDEFTQVRPWGKLGDRKCDGRMESQGIYYQVYAPEDIQKNYVEAVKKLKTDFTGLIDYWPGVRRYYFVVNDKYDGFNADCICAIQKIKKDYNLDDARIVGAGWLENVLFLLDDDQIISVVGHIPDPTRIKVLDYSIVNEVIEYIKKQPMLEEDQYDIIFPDWDDKIRFNELSERTSKCLDGGYIHIHSLEEYLSNQGEFLADELRDRVCEVYLHEKKSTTGDSLFWAMVNRLTPRFQLDYQNTVIVIMAKYFETCDIFEKPTGEAEK